jgi:hypothetical protein
MYPVSKDPAKEDPEVLKELVKNAPLASLIPYYLVGVNTPALYNGHRYIGDKPSANAFGIKDIPEQ